MDLEKFDTNQLTEVEGEREEWVGWFPFLVLD